MKQNEGVYLPLNGCKPLVRGRVTFQIKERPSQRSFERRTFRFEPSEEVETLSVDNKGGGRQSSALKVEDVATSPWEP